MARESCFKGSVLGFMVAAAMVLSSYGSVGNLSARFATSFEAGFVRPFIARVGFRSKLVGNGKEKPFIFEIEIQNISDKPVEVLSGSLYLEKKGQTYEQKQILGANYWAPQVMKLVPGFHSVTNSRFFIKPDETLKLRIDLDDLKWGQQMLSVYPSRRFKKVVEHGRYDLGIRLAIAEEKEMIRSEPIELTW